MRIDKFEIFLFCALCFSYLVQIKAQAQQCPDGVMDGIWGPNLTKGGTKTDADPALTSFLVFDRPAGCYGKIKEFDFHHSDVCQDINFQVYRPNGETDPKQYILVGEYLLPFRSSNLTACDGNLNDGRILFPVPREFQLPVQPGDLIGWQDVRFEQPWATTRRLFKYEDGNTGSSQFDVIHVLPEASKCSGDASVGESCPWDPTNADVTVLSRAYSLNAIYDLADQPLLENLPSETQVAEHLPPSQFVFNVKANNFRNWNYVIPVNLTYSLVRVAASNDPVQNLLNQNLFILNKTTKDIFTNKQLDHESIASYAANNVREAYYELRIRVCQDGEPVSDICSEENLRVHVTDVNEPHEITNLPTTVTISAQTNGVVNAFVFDVDHNEISNLTFGSTRDNELFWPAKWYTMVNEKPALDVFQINSNSGTITLKRDIRNWQSTNTTRLFITCTDGYYTTEPAVLTVVITDMRRPPHLENLPNVVSVPESTRNLDPLYTVQSSELPTGPPHYFSIVAVYPPTMNRPDGTEPFQINRYNGLVSIVNADFDYRLVEQYEVKIAVTDDLFTDFRDVKTENLTVEITIVNTVPFWLETDYVGWVDELSPLGTTVAGVSLRSDDLDLPFGDWVHYILSGPGSNHFFASNKTHRVHAVTPHELSCNQNDYTFYITLTVLDAAGAQNQTTLTVTVHDVNNHVPSFNQPHYSGRVSESWLGQTPVTNVVVRVDDCDGNEKYGLVDIIVVEEEARKYFEIVPFGCPTTCTADLLLKQPINYTEHNNMTFTLLASDRGDHRLNSTATVFVEVTDINDHAPEFVKEFYDLESRHNIPIGTTVEVVVTTDHDSDINSNVTYFLLLPDDHFTLEGSTGAVKNFREVDAYEKYILYAYARDYGNPEWYSDPSIVRIDTYPAQDHLVDIHMMLPLNEFKLIIDQFLIELNQQLHPWVAKQEQTLLHKDQSILTIYALTEAPPGSPEHLHYDKSFVHVNDLHDRLAKNIQGDPRDWLRTSEFSEYQVFKVLPTFPYWLIDTVGGIITLTLLCLALTGLLFLVFYLIYGYATGKRFCQKDNRVTPDPEPPRYKTPAFDLKYGEYNHVHAVNKKTGYGPFTGPGQEPSSVPISYTNTNMKLFDSDVPGATMMDTYT